MQSKARVNALQEGCLPAPAKASRSSPLESDLAMMVLAAVVYSPSLFDGNDISFTAACTPSRASKSKHEQAHEQAVMPELACCQ